MTISENINNAFLTIGGTVTNAIADHNGYTYEWSYHLSTGSSTERFLYDSKSYSADDLPAGNIGYIVNIKQRKCTVASKGYQYTFTFDSYRDLVNKMVDNATIREGLKAAVAKRKLEAEELSWFFQE